MREPWSDEFAVSVDVQQHWSVGGEHLSHTSVELSGGPNGNAGSAAQSGVVGEIRVDQGCLPDRVLAGQLFFADLA